MDFEIRGNQERRETEKQKVEKGKERERGIENAEERQITSRERKKQGERQREGLGN